MLPIAERLQSVASEIGVELELITGSPKHPHLAMRAWESPAARPMTKVIPWRSAEKE